MKRLDLSAALVALWLCLSAAAATPAYYCPADCVCTLSQHTHMQSLHAKCNGTSGLLLPAEELLSPGNIPIHSIDLSYLGLKRIGHILDSLLNLTSVDLSHNHLRDINHLSKHNLKKLNLKHNHLTSDKLVRLPQHLQLLNLQHNDITYLPMELTHLPHLQQLELGHNAINCSCSTLEVRNWLLERHVYMEKPVVCSQPSEARGKPWLQLKQTDVCEREREGWYEEDSNENELMMGDQPVSGSDEPVQEEEELGKDYLVIDKKSPTNVDVPPSVETDVEGSGDLTKMNMELKAATELPRAVTDAVPRAEALVVQGNEEEEEDENGSGSGGGMLIIPAIHRGPSNPDDFEVPDSPESEGASKDQDYDTKPLEHPDAPSEDIFDNNNLGIFKTEDKSPVSEQPIEKEVQTNLEVSPDVLTEGPVDVDKPSEDILTAKVGQKDSDSGAIYYLLGVIGLIVIGLILFVAIKRCKYNSNAAARDAEAQRQTELLDMDKKNLGKPLTRNGHEHAPLIGEKSKLDDAQIVNGKKPYDSKDGAGQQPLLNGNGAANGDAKDVPTINEPANEANGEALPHEYHPITPRYPTPQSPRASKYAQHPQGEGAEQNNNEPDGSFLPSSPKSGRYSPVYSPETGRVKIKLTETPKPKTPMLVTRSKSNAGDIITTPVGPGNYLAPTHQLVAHGGNTFGEVH